MGIDASELEFLNCTNSILVEEVNLVFEEENYKKKNHSYARIQDSFFTGKGCSSLVIRNLFNTLELANCKLECGTDLKMRKAEFKEFLKFSFGTQRKETERVDESIPPFLIQKSTLDHSHIMNIDGELQENTTCRLI